MSIRNNKANTRTIALLGALLAIICGQQQQQVSGQSCHLRELDLCAASLLVFVQAPNGLATSDHELNGQCKHIGEAQSCFNNYTRRCTTSVQRQLISFVANETVQLGHEYCTRGSGLRQTYLKHAQCLAQVQKSGQKACIRDLQVALDLLATPTATISKFAANQTTTTNELQQTTAFATGGDAKVRLACCAYRRFESCLADQIDKRCGRDATDFIRQVARRASSRLPELLCHQFKPGGRECKQVLPRPGQPAAPKAAKSSSIVSRLLAAYSGLQ